MTNTDTLGARETESQELLASDLLSKYVPKRASYNETLSIAIDGKQVNMPYSSFSNESRKLDSTDHCRAGSKHIAQQARRTIAHFTRANKTAGPILFSNACNSGANCDESNHS